MGGGPTSAVPTQPGGLRKVELHAALLPPALEQVEGLADLLAAETESQRRQALRHSTGAVRRQHEQWRQTLLTCLGEPLAAHLQGCACGPSHSGSSLGAEPVLLWAAPRSLPQPAWKQ